MKTAIVHDWLITEGGAEKVLRAMVDLYPSPIYTLIHDKRLFVEHEVHTTFLQRLPLRWYRNYLPLFPYAIGQIDLGAYDTILSSSHAVAKGVRVLPHQLHICYCHTPMRYAWDLHDEYIARLGGIRKMAAAATLRYLRKWDLNATVTHFVANSHHVAERIERLYGRKAAVIYPPVATSLFTLREKKDDFFITIARLVPYKKIDLLLDAFKTMPDQKLVVIGDGPEWKNLCKRRAANVELLGRVEETHDLLSRAKGFIHMAEEDFGIAPVEALACGTPVIAYGKGGVRETVVEGESGLFFHDHSGVNEAVRRFLRMEFDPKRIRRHAERFSEERFNKEFQTYIEEKRESHHSRRR